MKGGSVQLKQLMPWRQGLIIFRSADSGEPPKQNPKVSLDSFVFRRENINHIVLAEDDSDDSEFFKMAVSSLSPSIALTVAEHGKDLLKILKEAVKLPDFVFLDLNMPRMNGYECIKAIRDIESFRDLKVIVLSTSGDEETVDLLYRLGATAFVKKPTYLESWIVLLKKTLSIVGSHDRLLRDKFLIAE